MFIQKIAGHKIVFYSVRELAVILGKHYTTVKDWISKGYIPEYLFTRIKNSYDFIKGEMGQEVGLYAEQEVNALIAIMEKWEIKGRTRFDKIPGFSKEVAHACEHIREMIKSGKVEQIDYGFMLKFNDRDEAEELMLKILKDTKRPNQTLRELSAAIVRELIQYRDVDLTRNVRKKLDA